jgi:hypothetical protein
MTSTYIQPNIRNLATISKQTETYFTFLVPQK